MRLEDLAAEFDARDWDTRPDGTVRMAVVGLGGFARGRALPAIRESDYCVTGAVVSGHPGKAADVAEEYDAVQLSYEEFADGRRTDAYDAVYASTPNSLHLPHVETAASNDKHVLCEKPLEASVERAAEAVETCAESGVTLMTAYRMQTDPAVRRLRELLSDGGLGRPIKLFGDFTYQAMGGSHGPDHWRFDPDLAGGGALMDVGVYPLNAARFLLGEEPDWVMADTRTDEPVDEVDAHVDFQVGFSDAVGNFSASFFGDPTSHLAVQGTAGRAILTDAFEPDGDRHLRVERGDERVDLAGLGTAETVAEFDYFAHCVLTGTAPEPDGTDGLRDIRTMMAAYESATTGSRVAIEY